MSHTPGPWKATEDEIFTADGSGYGANVQHDGWTADARLIAAAPDLLEAARHAWYELRAAGIGLDKPHPCVEMLAAAIAKAEGK